MAVKAYFPCFLYLGQAVCQAEEPADLADTAGMRETCRACFILLEQRFVYMQ